MKYPTSQWFWAEHAILDGELVEGVRLGTESGRFASITPGRPRPGAGDDVTVLDGLVLPGLANAHSHAFHRALRGRTHGDGGTFWTWRERMYALAGRLDPDNYRRLATAVYAEMVLAGVTCVGEFHYVHHRPDGSPYQDPNAMGLALVEAAEAAGLRITLLDTCYLAGGLVPDGHLPLAPEQARFGDGSAQRWAERVRALPRHAGHARLGAAIHSVRAVPSSDPDGVSPVRLVAEVAHADGLPLHVHLSEQTDENEAALARYGLTPTGLLAREGVLGEHTTVVHAVHLSADDITLLGGTGTGVCACPSTEADLADGIGPFPELAAAGSPLCLGSDQHAHTDLLAEAAQLEQHERLRSGRRGTFTASELARIATESGHRALGWQDAGRIAAGQRADLVAIRLDTVRTAGSRPEEAILAAAAADVHTVVVDGAVIVHRGRHRLGDVGRRLAQVIAELWDDNRWAELAHPRADSEEGTP